MPQLRCIQGKWRAQYMMMFGERHPHLPQMVRQDYLVSRPCLVNHNDDRLFPKGEMAKCIRKNINSTPTLKIVSFSIHLAGQLMCMGITIICSKTRTKRQYKPPTVLIYQLNRYPRNTSVVTKAVYRKNQTNIDMATDMSCQFQHIRAILLSTLSSRTVQLHHRQRK